MAHRRGTRPGRSTERRRADATEHSSTPRGVAAEPVRGPTTRTRLFTECSRYCELVSQPAEMPRVARTAIHHALGRSGVSVLAISGDVLHRSPARPAGSSHFAASRATASPPAVQVRALAEQLNAAETVALLCGVGAKDAHAEVMRLAEKLQSPVGHTLRGKEWIQFDNPYDVGMSGLLGYGACYQATQRNCSGCCGCRSPPPSRPSR